MTLSKNSKIYIIQSLLLKKWLIITWLMMTILLLFCLMIQFAHPKDANIPISGVMQARTSSLKSSTAILKKPKRRLLLPIKHQRLLTQISKQRSRVRDWLPIRPLRKRATQSRTEIISGTMTIRSGGE